MNPFEYVRPASLAAVHDLVKERGAKARLKAGGTDLLEMLKERTDRPGLVINLRSVKDLDGRIHLSEGGLAIGALATLASVASHEGIRKAFPAISDAAAAAATPQIRNVGTVGGNLCQRPRCWYFRSESFQCLKKGGDLCYAMEGENRYHAIFGNTTCNIVHPSNLAPAFWAHDATISVTGPKGNRDVAIADFWVRPEEDIKRECVISEGEVVTKVTMKAPAPGTRSAYRETREKLSYDWAVTACSAALTFDGAKVASARVILAAIAPVPMRAKKVEEALTGKPLSEETAAAAAALAAEGATPLRDNGYKVELLKAVVKRTLLACRA